MAGGSDRDGAPPGDRAGLRTAILNAALAKSGVISGIPFIYSLDRLAQRWHMKPWELDDAPTDWVIRGLEFERLEAVKVEED